MSQDRDSRETVQQLETFSTAHDMRAFASFLETEYRDKLDEQGLNYVQRMMSFAIRMDALITDVLSHGH